MELTTVIAFIQEFLYTLIVVSFFLWYAIYRGRQAMVNVIIGLYLGLLFTEKLPFTVAFENPTSTAVGSLVLFIAITIGATAIITKLMPLPYREKKFESLGKKLLLAGGATILVLLFSFHTVPIFSIVDISSPFGQVFQNPEYFFWWLVLPFALLYFHR